MWGASVGQVQLHLDILHDQIFPSLSSDSTGIVQEHNKRNSSRSNCERVVKETSFSHMHRPAQSPDLNPIELFWDVLCKTSCSPIINAKL